MARLGREPRSRACQFAETHRQATGKPAPTLACQAHFRLLTGREDALGDALEREPERMARG